MWSPNDCSIAEKNIQRSFKQHMEMATLDANPQSKLIYTGLCNRCDDSVSAIIGGQIQVPGGFHKKSKIKKGILL